MSLTKEKWADPEFRKKMKEAAEKAKLNPKDKEIADPYTMTDTGFQHRLDYIPLPKNWKNIKHTNTKAIEQSLQGFCQEMKNNGWLNDEAPKKRSHKAKVHTEFNNGPLTLTKEKIAEWHQRQESPLDKQTEADTFQE